MSTDQAIVMPAVDSVDGEAGSIDQATPAASVASPAAEPGRPRNATVQTDKPASRLKRGDLLTIVGRGLTTLGILILAFAVFVVSLSWLVARRDQRDLMRRYRNEAANALAPVGGAIKEGSPVAVIDIPRLHVHMAVVEGTTSADLTAGPGHLRASPLPGQRGNVVIAGRRLAYGGPFLRLGRLKAGDKVTTITGQGQATYVVVGRPRLVGQGAPDVLGASADNRITLVTSDPVLLASQRLVVVARLQGAAQGSPSGRPVEVRPEEDALRGQGAAALPLLVWAELLLVAVAAATWLRRHWQGANVWLLAAPVVTALVWLVFTHLTRLLPATL